MKKQHNLKPARRPIEHHNRSLMGIPPPVSMLTSLTVECALKRSEGPLVFSMPTGTSKGLHNVMNSDARSVVATAMSHMTVHVSLVLARTRQMKLRRRLVFVKIGGSLSVVRQGITGAKPRRWARRIRRFV